MMGIRKAALGNMPVAYCNRRGFFRRKRNPTLSAKIFGGIKKSDDSENYPSGEGAPLLRE